MRGLILVHVPFLNELIVFLVATVAIVPLAGALRVSPILGYLAVGIMVGPSVLGLVSNVDEIRAFAELGVVFLMFAVGLELSFERLKTFASLIFGLGAAQVVVTAVTIGAIAYGWGNSPEVSIILGLCLALSSTAMVLQLLTERGQLVTRHGRASFAVLLFQDLAVVPILMLVTLFGSQGQAGSIGPEVLSVLIKAILTTVAIVLLGHFLLPRLFHLVTVNRTPEIFVALALLVILVTSLATGLAGLSMALGAFLAGLLLSKTEFRHQIESDIEPFKGLLLGLFFMSVGMSIDLHAVADRAVLIAFSVLGLISLKATVAFGLCLAFGLSREVSFRASLLLAEAGEFAFVVIGVATLQYALIPPDIAQFMVIVVGISMAVTPILSAAAERVGHRLKEDPGEDDGFADIEELNGHVIIAGFGRVGQTVAKLLAGRQVPYVAVDLDLARVRSGRQRGEQVVYGNAAKREILEKLGAEHAALILVTLGDPKATEKTMKVLRRTWPQAKLLARAFDVAHAEALQAIGVDDVVPEALEASLQLGGLVLRKLGLPAATVNETIERARTIDYQAFRHLGDVPETDDHDGNETAAPAA